MKHWTQPESFCRFGIARRDITPPVGIYHRMWGAAAHDRSEGIHRPLTATAVVFEPLDSPEKTTEESGDEQTGNAEHTADRQILVALDHCLLFHREMEQLRQHVEQAADIDPDEWLVVFSHTHAAGLMELQRSDLPGGEYIVPYLDSLAARMAEAVQEAVRSVQPAVISYATGRCALAAHRDFFDEERQQYVCGFNPEGEADDTVMVARVCDAAGHTKATFVNYACHPTTLAWDNRLISPDFVGAMREVIEQATGAPSVFLQGASGDLGPRVGFVGETDVADANGRQLGYAALSALNALLPPLTQLDYAGPVLSGATIGVWNTVPLSAEETNQRKVWRRQRETVPLPYRPGLPSFQDVRQERHDWQQREQAARGAGNTQQAAEARAMVERKTRQLTRLEGLPAGEEFPFPVHCWQMGNALWLAVEGEPYQSLQRTLRRQFPGLALVMMELANGSRCGYLPVAEAYGKGIYQESIALLAPGSLEQLTDVLAGRISAFGF